MSIRRWLAKKLYPQAFEDAERHAYALLLLDDLYQWCGYEFPAVGSAALWVKRKVRQRFMDRATYQKLLDERCFDQTHVDGIDGFREMLRRGDRL